MNNIEKIWYSKQDVLNIFPIHERTYFRKIKEINENIVFKEISNSNGTKSKLIHYKSLYEVFHCERRPKNINDLDILFKYIITKKWDYIGNIVPINSSLNVLVFKMNFLFKMIREIDLKCEMFFSIEKNSKDSYYHSHFLLNTKLSHGQIFDLLSLICDDNTSKSTRKYLKLYDFENKIFSGSFYSFKLKKLDSYKCSLFHQYLY